MFEEGEVHDLPDSKAEEAVEKGLAEKVGSRESEAAWDEMEKRLDKEPEKPGDNWLTAENVEIGDEIEIKGKGRWDDQFAEGEDGKDLVLPVKANGQEFEWRLNKTQMRKMADAFGNKTGDWVGESAIVEKIVKYESLGKKGFKITAEK